MGFREQFNLALLVVYSAEILHGWTGNTGSTMSYDAIVIGGGIVGMSTAYHLVHAGARTLLVDRKDKGRATDAGAGILSPATNTRDPGPLAAPGRPCRRILSGTDRESGSRTGGETGFAICGMMIVAVSDDELEPFEIARRHIFSRRSRQGRPSEEDLFEISSEEARSRFPALADVRGAIYYREAARVDGRLLTAALRRAAVARGLTVRQTRRRRAARRQRCGHRRPDGRGGRFGGSCGYRRRRVVARVRASTGSPDPGGTAARSDHSSGSSGHRRYVVTWPIISAIRGHYMVPWPDNRVVVGATRETGSGFDARTTAAGVREVLGEALRVAPGLAGAEIREIRVGLRPYTQDLLPVLGPRSRQERRLPGNRPRAHRPSTGAVQRQTRCRPDSWQQRPFN